MLDYELWRGSHLEYLDFVSSKTEVVPLDTNKAESWFEIRSNFWLP